MPESPLLRIEDLGVSFATGAGRVRAVQDVSVCVYPRQTVALVGESGCGKSVTALSTLKLVPTPPGAYEAGSIVFDNQNLLGFSEKQMRRIRGNQIAMIFQEPMTSLNPVYTIGDQIMEAVLLHQRVSKSKARQIAEQALNDVGIADAASRLDEYPHQMSGGMRQRVMIAMALACRPRLLLADEPTTALDVTIQAQILALLRKLQEEHEMSILLITHDLGVVAENADVVAVMYAGRVVEYGTVHDIFDRPLHPYTRGLFLSMPKLGEAKRRLATIPGTVPNPADFPPGCPFHPRCSLTHELAEKASPDQTVLIHGTRKSDVPDHRVVNLCVGQDPPLLEVTPGHWAACWFTDSYADGQRTRPDLSYRREPVGV
jgi:oligopeptide/dipeptide ABC transporter ATP-binding protein